MLMDFLNFNEMWNISTSNMVLVYAKEKKYYNIAFNKLACLHIWTAKYILCMNENLNPFKNCDIWSFQSENEKQSRLEMH